MSARTATRVLVQCLRAISMRSRVSRVQRVMSVFRSDDWGHAVAAPGHEHLKVVAVVRGKAKRLPLGRFDGLGGPAGDGHADDAVVIADAASLDVRPAMNCAAVVMSISRKFRCVHGAGGQPPVLPAAD